MYRYRYAHIEIVVAVVVVNIFSCLIMASYGAEVMTWEVGGMLSYVSSTFLYSLEAKTEAPIISGKNKMLTTVHLIAYIVSFRGPY